MHDTEQYIRYTRVNIQRLMKIQSKPLSLSLMISPISYGNRRAKLTLMKSASVSLSFSFSPPARFTAEN